MTCSAMRPLIEPFLDGELDAGTQAQIAGHVVECPSCQDEYRNLERLRNKIREGNLAFVAPDSLRRRVFSTVRASGTKPAGAWKGIAIAASVFLMLSLGWNAALLRQGLSVPLGREILSEHVRSMMGGHLTEVESTDRHTVKPWFSGKLDFSPDVKNLASQGFPLTGGRVDYLDGRRVAALVFMRDKHVITLFTWPSPRAPNETASRDAYNHDGFNLVEWTKGGMIYWAVSDVNAADLQRFAELYRNN